MKRKYSIGLFVGIIILFLTFTLAYRISYNQALEKQRTSEKEEVQAEIEICYYIMNLEGYVTVYEGDKKTVYEYTSIRVESLPDSLQDKINQGLKLTSLKQVYGILENYSS